MKTNLFYVCQTESSLHWSLGESIYCGASLKEALLNLSNTIQLHPCDYLLFIDLTQNQLPSENNIQYIIEELPGEIWHAGLQNLNHPFPVLYNYYQPTWMYNLPVENTIASTSWCLSADCFLAKTIVFTQLFEPCTYYQSMIAMGNDIGYCFLKSGAIIRYEPKLTALKHIPHQHQSVPFKDACIFMKRHIGTKWYGWSLYRHLMNTGKIGQILSTVFTLPKTILAKPKQVVRTHPPLAISSTIPPTVSVFTPTLQRYEYLQVELDQLRNQTIKPSQIIITDQTDLKYHEISWLEKYSDLPILYKQQTEKGQCNAWNFCLEHATGEYVLFLGDDADEIRPDFIEELYRTLQTYKADVVACNIKEDSVEYPFKQTDVFITDTFPICLVRKSIFKKSGGYDYAYNKGSRADGDLAIRLHLNGALLVLNPHIKIHHHRAPIGGLRHHKQRVITSKTSRERITHFQLPSFTEIYLFNRYFNKLQVKEILLLKKLSSLAVNGGIVKQFSKLLIALFSIWSLNKKITVIKSEAQKLTETFPNIPKIDV